MGRRTHIIIIDGTLSRLEPGLESNAGLLYKLLCEGAKNPDLTLYYNPGIHGAGLRKWLDVAAGIGINAAICAAYAHLARHYRRDDRILLFGFSRGAYAVRSLAGMIGRAGLLTRASSTPKRGRRAFDLYENAAGADLPAFSRQYCFCDVEIEMIGVWDTVKALGLPYPVLSRFAPMATEFHDHHLGPGIRNAFQALALDETRTAYAPILWDCVPGWTGRAEQLWFAGAHADIGGQIEGFAKARPLSNIPLVWMLEKARPCGLPLPDGWKARFPTDPTAPMYGATRGITKLFLLRTKRNACTTPFDHLHESVPERMEKIPAYHPKACLPDQVSAEMMRAMVRK